MPIDQPRITDRHDAEMAQYRSLCATAVLGLILGLLSPLAIVSRPLLVVPLLGAAVSGLALWRIARNVTELAGRKAALVGLILSCFFAASVGSQRFYYNRLICSEAEQFASIWFGLLAEDRPYDACQLFLKRDERRQSQKSLGDFYRNRPKLREEIDSKYLGLPPVKLLLELGPKAKVQDMQTVGLQQKPQSNFVQQVYSVSYVEDGKNKTVPIELNMERKVHPDGRVGWQIAGVRVHAG
jgi:hypothetical protein